MKMLYATCVPHLTFASDVVYYTASEMQTLNVALNDCIRRIFTYNRWESVRYLRLSFGFPSLIEIFENRSRKFLKQLPTLGNPTLHRLHTLYEQRISQKKFSPYFFYEISLVVYRNVVVCSVIHDE